MKGGWFVRSDKSSVIRQKDESQNGYFNKKQANKIF